MLRPYIALIAHFLLGWLNPMATDNFGAPSQPPSGTKGSPSGLALVAAGLSIASWFIIPLVGAIAGMIAGKMELNNIDAGQSPEEGRIFAQIGWYAGLANLLLSVVGTCIGLAFFFGLFGLIAGGAAMSEGVQ